MATNTLTYHEVAQKKQTRRRLAAQQVGASLAGDNLDALHKIGVNLFGVAIKEAQDNENDYNTVAIGHLYNKDSQSILLVACKGIKAKPLGTIVAEAKEYFPTLTEGHTIILQNEVSVSGGGSDHVHAEMAIVQALYYKLQIPKSQIPSCGVQIACILKGVCPDCSGWLTRHNIPHTWRRGHVASSGWTNPLTGAFFKYSGTNLQYNKLFWSGFQVEGKIDTMSSKQNMHPKSAKYA